MRLRSAWDSHESRDAHRRETGAPRPFVKYLRYTYGMLQLCNSLVNRPVRSLRTGSVVATTLTPIINPNNLKIIGFVCQDHETKRKPILLEQDIRDIIPQGFVINDHEVLTDAAELVRYKDIIELGFTLLGKQVVTDKKRRLGKVNDYATDTSSMFIQKIYVSQSLLKSFGGGQFGIDRSQIIEITNKTIIIRDPLQPQPANAVTVPV